MLQELYHLLSIDPLDGVKGKTWGPSVTNKPRQRASWYFEGGKRFARSAPNLEKSLKYLGGHSNIGALQEMGKMQYLYQSHVQSVVWKNNSYVWYDQSGVSSVICNLATASGNLIVRTCKSCDVHALYVTCDVHITDYEDDEWPEELGGGASSRVLGGSHSSSLPYQAANGSAHEVEALKRFAERKKTDVCLYNMSSHLAAVALGFDVRRTNDSFGNVKAAASGDVAGADKVATADNKSSSRKRESHIGNRRDAYRHRRSSDRCSRRNCSVRCREFDQPEIVSSQSSRLGSRYRPTPKPHRSVTRCRHPKRR